MLCNLCSGSDPLIRLSMTPWSKQEQEDNYSEAYKRSLTIVWIWQWGSLNAANAALCIWTLRPDPSNDSNQLWKPWPMTSILRKRLAVANQLTPFLKYFKKINKSWQDPDVGCATGFLLDQARKQGWEVYGVELSAWAVDYAKNKPCICLISTRALSKMPIFRTIILMWLFLKMLLSIWQTPRKLLNKYVKY